VSIQTAPPFAFGRRSPLRPPPPRPAAGGPGADPRSPPVVYGRPLSGGLFHKAGDDWIRTTLRPYQRRHFPGAASPHLMTDHLGIGGTTGS